MRKFLINLVLENVNHEIKVFQRAFILMLNTV